MLATGLCQAAAWRTNMIHNMISTMISSKIITMIDWRARLADGELVELDRLAARVFEGYVVRKDLARCFKARYPVPEYVAEFLLGLPALLALCSALLGRSLKGGLVAAGSNPQRDERRRGGGGEGRGYAARSHLRLVAAKQAV